MTMSGQDLTDTSGYFLYEKQGSGETAGIEIIAQVISEEAALKLRDVLGMD